MSARKEYMSSDRKCEICNSTEDVDYYPTDGFTNKDGIKTFYSGGVRICKKCIAKCEICSVCGKLIPSAGIEKYIGNVMKHPAFCEHLFAHKKINELKKKYNIRNT